MGSRVLLIGVYGMELVECGGALAANVAAGGSSHAALMVCDELMRTDVAAAAEVLGVPVEFLGFRQGHVAVDEAHVLDKAAHVYHGVGHHGRYAFAEAYRREGDFHLPTLIE